MIIQANYDHVHDALCLLKMFLNETAYAQAEFNREHMAKIVWNSICHGYVWIDYEDTKPKGLLIAVNEPNLWVPDRIQFRELVWYVLPEYRKTSIGGRLFKTFLDKGQELLEQQKINGIFTTRMSTTDAVDLERRGFQLKEQTYLKEH